MFDRVNNHENADSTTDNTINQYQWIDQANTIAARRYRKVHGMGSADLRTFVQQILSLCLHCWRIYNIVDVPLNEEGYFITMPDGTVIPRCCPYGVHDDPFEDPNA